MPENIRRVRIYNSKYRGVSRTDKGSWRTDYGGYIGVFSSEEIAARAYDVAVHNDALNYRKNDFRLNFASSIYESLSNVEIQRALARRDQRNINRASQPTKKRKREENPPVLFRACQDVQQNQIYNEEKIPRQYSPFPSDDLLSEMDDIITKDLPSYKQW